MKKETIVALVMLLLIPIVLTMGGLLFSMINPEIAAGHPNYVRNYHLLSVLKIGSALASAAVVAILWLLACFLMIRSKERSPWWLLCAAFGPLGFAILAMLSDRSLGEMDPYARFIRKMNGFVRAGYEVCSFVIICVLAYQGMVLMRYLIIGYQTVTSGMSAAQIMNQQNASSGMWAFGEGIEVIFMLVLLYLIRPILFNMLTRGAERIRSPKVT